jgi:hypothetical protein
MIMNNSNGHDIIKLEQFIEATRDSGYKSTASSIAELIDNSLEAGATDIEIHFTEPSTRQIQVSVRDNGCGMTPVVLRLALRFGGSTRFNSRKGTGRYGMGLPNSSLSRARRVDVYTWRRPKIVWWTYLDVDEIASGKLTSVPDPKRAKLNPSDRSKHAKSGTVVVWSKCDRLDYRNVKKLISKLSKFLGQTFRHEIWKGKCIRINGEYVRPVDPMFLRKGDNLVGAIRYGSPMNFEIRIPQVVGGGPSLSTVRVKFSELPIENWHHLSNDEKRTHGISKRAGASIVRSGREIDYGWFFMGSKRKENYDDWWRCELHFDAALDELFGVTHTKQGIHPTAILRSILSPDIERVAHTLNSRVRGRYLKVRSGAARSTAVCRAESRDHLLEPPAKTRLKKEKLKSGSAHANKDGGLVSGFAYRIEHKALDEPSFFVPLPTSSELIVLLNEEHPFYERVYHPIVDARDIEVRALYGYLEILLLAAARAECSVTSSQKIKWARSMRESWSKTLAAFLD